MKTVVKEVWQAVIRHEKIYVCDQVHETKEEALATDRAIGAVKVPVEFVVAFSSEEL